MRFFFTIIVIIAFFISGCIETPEVSSSKKDIAQKQIESNKSEAQKAKEEYNKLQKERKSELDI
jgi:NADH:ubiquinone oxidoreductase subunit B-like Fe-S oxidoreductase